MVGRGGFCLQALTVLFLFFLATTTWAQQAGSIRGMVYDKDFDTPLPLVDVSIAETGRKITSTDQGNFVFEQVLPGSYTLVFSKEGFLRHVKADVVVSPGEITEVDVRLSGEIEELEEFIVEDLKIGSGTEADLLVLRIESPSLMDSISSDLMAQAGASDAASALKLVSGATVQDGKFAVIRGLPDRYVNSQMNGVRLPTSDAEKRAVQLDQFPSAVIESVQVSKTFTPDQQGDASGGAVNVVLKGIPNEAILQLKVGTSVNTQVARGDFLTYKGGGVNFLGFDDGGRDIIQSTANDNDTVGVSRGRTPIDYDLGLTIGGKYELDDGVKIGGFTSLFYERNNTFYDKGIDDARWVENPGDPMTPQFNQGTPTLGDFKTSLFDVTEGSQEVKWGAIGSVGVETENHSLTLLDMYTHVAEDVATLAEDTRGKEFYFPGYDRNDPNHPGNQNKTAAPYLRTETLEYTERTTQTLQLTGRHKLLLPEFGRRDFVWFLPPEVDWTVARSSADFDQPDKRQFGSQWETETVIPAFPPFIPNPIIIPAHHSQSKPAANINVGNLQRIWKDISEESDQYFINLKLPFEQWSGDKGYMKFGVFNDQVTRHYNQDSFSNSTDINPEFNGEFEEFWSAVWPSEVHPITADNIDVDYRGEQSIEAWYYMADLPLNSYFNVIGGARFESTKLSIINTSETDVIWIPPGASGPVQLNPGDADVSFEQDDTLPSIGFVFTPIDQVTLRGSYSETVARQTFRELSPIQQQEFLGGDVFIGNPELRMSALKNYDLRVDYRPFEGGLFSVSYFFKDVKDPIEFVQRNVGFTFTTPVNYPKGEMSGIEVEVRQQMGHFWEQLEGLSVGGNATFIESEVTLPEDEAAGFLLPNIMAPMSSRDMTGTPEHLYNVYLTYDVESSGTQFSLFYTVRGDTLVTGAGQSNGNFVPNVYAAEFDTLNLSVAQELGEHWKLKFQAKNLTNPRIEEIYRSEFINGDVVKTSYKRGIEFSISISAEIFF